MVIVDDDSDSAVAAADMLAQAEHDVLAAPVLVALSDDAVKAVENELATQLESLPRAEIAMSALNGRGGAVIVDTVDDALKVAEVYAPEHLCFGIRRRGRDFGKDETRRWKSSLESYRGEVMADYVAGPSHVMPTGGSARFSSALSARDFVRVTPFLDLDDETFAELAGAATDLARFGDVGSARSRGRDSTQAVVLRWDAVRNSVIPTNVGIQSAWDADSLRTCRL